MKKIIKFIKEFLKNPRKYLKKTLVLLTAFFILNLSVIFYLSNHKEFISEIYAISGEVFLNDEKLELENSKKLKAGDNIKTIGENSLGVIYWGDGSLTRIGGNSKILVSENMISNNKKKIAINFKLEYGKSWSKVVSYTGGEESYFKQNFSDYEAAVRGTSFDVNLEKGYIFAPDNPVNILEKKSGKILTISNGEAFDLIHQKIIYLLEFVQQFSDKTWYQINKNLDFEHLKNLEKELKEKLSKITIWERILAFFSEKYKLILEIKKGANLEEILPKLEKLSPKNKEFVLDKVYENFQDFNVLGKTSENYNFKEYYNQIIYDLSSAKEKLKLEKYFSFESDLFQNFKNSAEKTLQDLQNSAENGLNNLQNIGNESLNQMQNDLKKVGDFLGEKDFGQYFKIGN